MKHQLGLTLLEVSVALSIGGVILLFGIGSLRYLERHAAINEVKSEIALLRFAAEEYHLKYAGCPLFLSTPTIDDLKDKRLLPEGFNPDNAFGEDSTVDFSAGSQVGSQPPTYDISLRLKQALRINAEHYAQFFSSNYHSITESNTGVSLIWKFPVVAMTPNQTGSLRQFREFYRASDNPRCMAVLA